MGDGAAGLNRQARGIKPAATGLSRRYAAVHPARSWKRRPGSHEGVALVGSGRQPGRNRGLAEGPVGLPHVAVAVPLEADAAERLDAMELEDREEETSDGWEGQAADSAGAKAATFLQPSAPSPTPACNPFDRFRILPRPSLAL